MSERLAPDSILTQTGLTGSLAAIQDDPDSPDGAWLTSAANTSTELKVSFPSPSATLQTGAGLQQVRVLVRKTSQTTAPTAVVELWETGGAAALATLVASTTINGQTVLNGTFDAALLADRSGAGVQVRVVGTVGGGSPSKRASVEVGAVEWNATVQNGTPFNATADAQATIGAAYTSQGDAEATVNGSGGGGSGTITLAGVTQADSAGTKSTSISLAVPAHTDGDLLLLVIVNMGGRAPTTHAGWTEVGQAMSGDGTSAGDALVTIYSRVAASEPASYTITQGFSWYGAAMLAYHGAASVEAFSTNGSPAAGSNSLTALSVTSGGAGRRLLTLWGQNKYPASGGGFLGDQAAGFVVEAATDDTNIGMEVDDGTVGAGPTGDHSNTPANLSSEPWAAMQVLVAPAVQGTPYSATADAELTVTALASLTATADAEVTVVRPAGNWFTDTFSRTSASGWGTSDTGAVWGDADDIADFTVDGSRGVITLPDSSSPHNNTIAEGSINAVDSTGRVTWAMDTLPAAGWVTMLRFYSRRGLDLGDTGDTDADDIRHAIRFRDNGSLELQHDYSINAVRTTVNATWFVSGKVYTPGDLWHARYEVTGSAPAITVRIRIWKDGDAEPTTWDLEETFDPGSTGVDHGGTTGVHLQTSASNTAFPVHVYLDDWTLDDLVSGTPFSASADAEVHLTAAYSAVADAAASISAAFSAVADAAASVAAPFSALADAAASIAAPFSAVADGAVVLTAGYAGTADAAASISATYSSAADAAASVSAAYTATADAEVSALHEFSASGDVAATITAAHTTTADAAATISRSFESSADVRAVVESEYASAADARIVVTVAFEGTGDAQASVLHVGFESSADVRTSVTADYRASGDAAAQVTADYRATADAQATALHVGFESSADVAATITADYVATTDAEARVAQLFSASADVVAQITATLVAAWDAAVRVAAAYSGDADAEATFPAAFVKAADARATVLHVGFEANADATLTVTESFSATADAATLVAQPYTASADTEVRVNRPFVALGDAALQVTAALAVIADGAVTVTAPFTARTDAETGILAVYYRGADVEARVTAGFDATADAETTVEGSLRETVDAGVTVSAAFATTAAAAVVIGVPLRQIVDAEARLTATLVAQADAEVSLIEANFHQFADAQATIRHDYPEAITRRGSAFTGRTAFTQRGPAFTGRGDPTTRR